jgi:hypothetical protein
MPVRSRHAPVIGLFTNRLRAAEQADGRADEMVGELSGEMAETMAGNDERMLRCTDRLIDAMEHLRLALEKREGALRAARARYDSGNSFSASLRAAKIAEERDELNDALFQLEQRRRESRLAVFRSALDHGVSINELARMWGFSRQMASRYAKDARREL